MNHPLATMAWTIAALCAAAPSAAQITLYEQEGYRGRSVTADISVRNMDQLEFADRASSIVVTGGRWEVCDGLRFQGHCVQLRRGNYPGLATMGLNNAISSIRNVDQDPVKMQPAPSPSPYGAHSANGTYGPPPPTVYDYHRRRGETLYSATVTSVRAIYGPSREHCWIERERVPGGAPAVNVTGAVAGAVIGGIIGHQFGTGRGRGIATVGGAAAGAAVGSRIGNGGDSDNFQDVQHCAGAEQGPPAYWEVTYSFRGQAHRMQTIEPPGATVTVNGSGEPRT